MNDGLEEEPRELRFDYATFDPDTRRLLRERAEQIRGLARVTASGIVEIGKYLTEVKAKLPHGQFLKWVRTEFGWTDRHARRFMEVYGHVKSDKLSNLSIDVSALYLIAAPSTPELVRAEVIHRAENGEHVSHRRARALVQRFEETGELPEVETLPERIVEQLRPTQLPRNKRQRASDSAALRWVMERAYNLKGFTESLRELDPDAAARADAAPLDLAQAIRLIHKSRRRITEWERKLKSALAIQPREERHDNEDEKTS